MHGDTLSQCIKGTKLSLAFYRLNSWMLAIAAHANILSVVTVVHLERQGWTVQQRCLVAVTLDFVQPDDSAVPSRKLTFVVVKRHVAAV